MAWLEKKFVCAGMERNSYQKHIPAPMFRRSFVLASAPEKAEIYISGLGFYQLYINGKDITKGLLAPYISNSDQIIYYDYYDITAELHPGENVIGVILGNGMQNSCSYLWDFAKAEYASSPKLAFSFYAEVSGERVEFNAESFVCTESPIIFDDLRSGVFYDARLEQKGWNEPGFDDSGWRPVIPADTPRGIVKLCEAEPIRIHREIKPVSIRQGEYIPQVLRDDLKPLYESFNTQEGEPPVSGGYIYDFGENTAGVFRLRVKGMPGQKISLQCVETLTDGKADTDSVGTFYPHGYAQRDIYICSGEGMEEFIPPFTYHGFRYIYVTGITSEQATEELLTCLVANSDLNERGGFVCSSETVNTLFEMTNRSDLSCFQYFPVDCPHREKNGWTGDAAFSAEHMILKFGVENSWREWLNCIRLSQRQDGSLPGIIPTTGWGYDWGNGPAWDQVLFVLPYITYIYRGDKQIIVENSHAMMRYLVYLTRKADNRGLYAFGLGDWLPVGFKDVKAPLVVTDSIIVYYICTIAEVMFRAVGMPENAEYAKTLAVKARAAIRRHLIDFSTMTVAGNCQTSQAMALHYGIFDDSERPAAFDRLLKLIEENQGNFDCGCLGIRVLFHVLAEHGHAELAYHMITKKDYPSYAHLIEQGETTMVEAFVPDGMSPGSHNHHFLGDISHWFMRHVGGLNINPALDNPNVILVKPRFIQDLDNAKVWHDLPAGRVIVQWNREKDGIIRLKVECPGEVVCHIQLENGWRFADGLAFAECPGEYTVVKC